MEWHKTNPYYTTTQQHRTMGGVHHTHTHTSRLSLLSASLSRMSNIDSLRLSAYKTINHQLFLTQTPQGACLLERSHSPSYFLPLPHPLICICSQGCTAWRRVSSEYSVSPWAPGLTAQLGVYSARRQLDRRRHLYGQNLQLLHLAVCPLEITVIESRDRHMHTIQQYSHTHIPGLIACSAHSCFQNSIPTAQNKGNWGMRRDNA